MLSYVVAMEKICRRCGSRKNIEVHWVAHSPEQFIPLCSRCHRLVHKENPELDKEFPDWKITTISIRMGTKIRLSRFGRFGEKWNELLNRLMDEVEEYRKIKELYPHLFSSS